MSKSVKKTHGSDDAEQHKAGLQAASQLADLLEEGKELDAMSHELVRTAILMLICLLALGVLWVKFT